MAETWSHADYTVGWICALAKELVAAKVMLDKTHPPLSQLPNDPNSYTFGSIGEHNIVIACLPETGTINAATSATWMASSFSNIRVTLMVGIGGGIPPKVNIGDIVVSMPVDKYPGVVQYDFGKAETTGFRRTGALNKPRPALLAAIRNLQANHDISGFDLQRYLGEVKERNPKLKPEYLYPPTEPEMPPRQDEKIAPPPSFLLYIWKALCSIFYFLVGQWAFPPLHSESKNNRSAAGTALVLSSADGTIQRQHRVKSEVRYGLIASGDQVIKDAKFRDEVDRSLDYQVLCVEMEASGLMDNFGPLVIRGICDLANAEKHKAWQEYAAVIAAAYTKDLLMSLKSVEVQKEIPIRDILHQQGQSSTVVPLAS
ncbi:hypothetical protein TWF718_007694 [Orbilia javanica]|uniref:Nucleoside phosphorylase domain-containing protein n=1 Tax=Orbilia javanica TaxID=47235 RepID=A0AAN8MPC3_9PEZI